jgi:hypothetical protein
MEDALAKLKAEQAGKAKVKKEGREHAKLKQGEC